ncbi:hypothetical protein B0H16DRAFT_1464073 [Mycena metata]|uniref:Uncharacterized protein n=1 Tax=Mycena metata TaxID=1033252 RepID=A0AAD7IGN1_9AGAR|nr:hypothetical protein B0H16DRAFT_1464073 [Mycena metata]
MYCSLLGRVRVIWSWDLPSNLSTLLSSIRRVNCEHAVFQRQGLERIKPKAQLTSRYNIRLLTNLLWHCTTPNNAEKRDNPPRPSQRGNATIFGENLTTPEQDRLISPERGWTARRFDLHEPPHNILDTYLLPPSYKTQVNFGEQRRNAKKHVKCHNQNVKWLMNPGGSTEFAFAAGAVLICGCKDQGQNKNSAAGASAVELDETLDSSAVGVRPNTQVDDSRSTGDGRSDWKIITGGYHSQPFLMANSEETVLPQIIPKDFDPCDPDDAVTGSGLIIIAIELGAMDNTSSSITKGTHGGARKGAGRPRKTVVSVAQNQRDTTLGYPIRSNIGHKTSHPSAPPAAFFLPRNTNQPVPSGSQQIYAQAGRAFWADIVASQSDADTLPAASFSHISSREFTQLNEQLDYVQEHDEHGDISVGDNFIDDSIVDHSVDKSNPETLDPEPETVEPPGNSALHKQLKSQS